MFFSCFKRRASTRAGPQHGGLSTQIDVIHEMSKWKSMTSSATQTSSHKRRGWAVFWDFENLALWKRYRSVSDILQSVRASLSKLSKIDVHDHVTLFYAIGNLERIPVDVNTGLKQHGIETVNSISKRKNAADLVIVTEIMRCLIQTPTEGICLISNDGDFSHCMQTVKNLGYSTALLHDNAALALEKTVGMDCSIDLSATYAHKTIALDRQTTPIENVKRPPTPTTSWPRPPPSTWSTRQNSRWIARQRSTGVHGQHPPHPSRPGLTHVIRVLEAAGGHLDYYDLQRRLGAMPRGWLANLLESGKALNRLSMYGNRVMLNHYSGWTRAY